MEPLIEELRSIRFLLQRELDVAKEASAREILVQVEQRAFEVGKSSSGSWLAGQESAYYGNFESPPPNQSFNRVAASLHGLKDGWNLHTYDAVLKKITEGFPTGDLENAKNVAKECLELLEGNLAHVKSIIQVLKREDDKFLETLQSELNRERISSEHDIIKKMKPNHLEGDIRTIAEGFKTPPHVRIFAAYASVRHGIDYALELDRKIGDLIAHMIRINRQTTQKQEVDDRIFIGHGRSQLWKELKEFIHDCLGLQWDEFSRVSTAGITITERLSTMLDSASFAFLVLTAEDDTADGMVQARMNVIHEAGLFQGRLGFDRAIILLEEGCEEFSNIHGLGQIRFETGKLSAKFEEIRQLLEEREIISK